MTRALVASLVALALVLAVAVGHELGTGRRAMAACDEARARGDVAGMIAWAHEAAEAAAPASPYPTRGYQTLDAIAADAEKRADDRTAIAALTAMRGAAIATSTSGSDAWRIHADQEIARIGSREWAGAARADSGVRPEASALAIALARTDAAPLGALACLGLGALAFFAGAARLLVVAPNLAAIAREKLATAIALAGLVLGALACLR